MSEWRDKAKEVYAAGEAERGNFTPTGAPKRIYQWWLENSDSKKARAIRYGDRRENFCHFWRVVVIWAGLLWLAYKVIDFADKFILNKVFGVTTLVITAVVLAVAFTVTGVWLDVLLALGLTVGVTATGAALFVGVPWLVERYWNHRWDDIAGKIAAIVMGVIAVSAVAFAITLGTINIGWIFPVALVVAVGIAAAIIYGLAKYSTYLSGKRALAKAKHREWLNTLTDEQYWAWRNEQDKAPEPTWLSKFFRAVGDFLILTTQIVRVKKWKICPFVEVN